MILTRRVLSASEALDWGIATRVSGIEDPESEVRALVESLLYGAPLAVQMAKQLVTSARSGNSNDVLEAFAAAATSSSDDLAEGMAAFREKRPPSFHDR
jgi:enoyl-CoA hydratase/carnithine racemase